MIRSNVEEDREATMAAMKHMARLFPSPKQRLPRARKMTLPSIKVNLNPSQSSS